MNQIIVSNQTSNTVNFRNNIVACMGSTDISSYSNCEFMRVYVNPGLYKVTIGYHWCGQGVNYRDNNKCWGGQKFSVCSGGLIGKFCAGPGPIGGGCATCLCSPGEGQFVTSMYVYNTEARDICVRSELEDPEGYVACCVPNTLSCVCVYITKLI